MLEGKVTYGIITP